MSNLKVLFFDLETAPLLAYVWGPREDWIPHDRMIHDSFLLAWTAKWRGEDKVMTGLLTSKEAKAQDDTRIVIKLADLIRQADIVVAHNANRFDVPMFNNRLLLLGLEPLGPVKTIDTLILSKKNFRLAYNKLDYLAEKLGIGNKISTTFGLWKECYHGDSAALKQMLEYNVKDVVLLEQVFDKMLPYVKNVPRLVDADYDGQVACPFCGSENLQKRGLSGTNVNTFQRFMCKACQKYSRLRVSIKNRLAVSPL